MRIWNRATGEPWAMTHDALATLLEIAARKNESPEVVAAKLGRELHNKHQMTMTNGIAVIPIVGSLFRYANVFTQVSGASSYEIIATDFRDAFANNDVHTIVFNIDSPGGEVNGCCDLAQTIFEARGKKPIIAYGSGDVASGAYWIASSCDKVIVSKTSSVGSIGVVGVYRHNKDDNTTEIVSSQSPHKRPDINTEDGKARLQQHIDAMADVFIDAVATYRSISTENVQQRYGGGDVFIGDNALKHGLIDGINTFDNVIAQLQQDTFQSHSTHSIHSTDLFTQEKTPMATTEKTTDAMASTQTTLSTGSKSTDSENLLEQGKQQERIRIQSILTHDEAVSRTDLAQHLAFSTDMAVDAAIATLKSAPQTTTALTSNDTTGFHAAMGNVTNPNIIPSSVPDNDDAKLDALAKSIVNS